MKCREHTVKLSLKLGGWEAEVVEMNKNRQVRLREKSGSCADISCAWYDCTVEVLTLNNHNVAQFSQDMYDCLDKGRSKDRNIMLIGPANTGKIFMLKPLQFIFGKLSLAGWASRCLSHSLKWLQVVRGQHSMDRFSEVTGRGNCQVSDPKESFRTRRGNWYLQQRAHTGHLEYKLSHPNYHEETGMMDKRWKYYKTTHVFGTSIISCDWLLVLRHFHTRYTH